MKLHITMDLEFDSEDDAKAVAQALEIDNDDFVDTDLDGKRIKAVIDANGISSAIQTLDIIIPGYPQ